MLQTCINSVLQHPSQTGEEPVPGLEKVHVTQSGTVPSAGSPRCWGGGGLLSALWPRISLRTDPLLGVLPPQPRFESGPQLGDLEQVP